jgi:hypothetical protein
VSLRPLQPRRSATLDSPTAEVADLSCRVAVVIVTQCKSMFMHAQTCSPELNPAPLELPTPSPAQACSCCGRWPMETQAMMVMSSTRETRTGTHLDAAASEATHRQRHNSCADVKFQAARHSPLGQCAKWHCATAPRHTRTDPATAHNTR